MEQGMSLSGRDLRVEQGGRRSSSSSSSSRKEEEVEETNQLRTELWELLPQVLVELILTKLPFSSLSRCCCVCKNWRSFILSGYALLFFDSGQLSVRQSSGTSWERVPLRFLQVGDCSLMTLVASARGLLCFSTDVIGEFVICNPLTTCFKKLQMPSLPFFSRQVRNSGGLLSKVVLVGMVPISGMGGGFKLIVAGVFRGSRGETLVYDSLFDSWTKVANVPTCAFFFLTRAVTWRGNMYTIFRDTSFNYKLLKFEVETETWSLVLLPEEPGFPCTLIEHRGKLLLMNLTSIDQYPGGFAYFELRDSPGAFPSWLPVNSLPLNNVLDAMSLRISKFPGVPDHLRNITCLGQGDVICFVEKIDRSGLGACAFDYKPILRMCIHNFSTNTEVVLDLQVEFFKHTYQIFKPSMEPL